MAKSKPFASQQDVEDFLRDQENELMAAKGRRKMSFSDRFRNSLPESGGIYAFFCKGKIFYVGETTCLRKRLASDMRNPENHVLALKIARLLYDAKYGNGSAGKEKKFEEAHKAATRKWIEDNLRVKCFSMLIGRRELEERVHANRRPEFNDRYPQLP
jgi:hypothetical protein